MMPTLFNRYDENQLKRRQLFHRLRGVVLKMKYKKRKREEHYQGIRPKVVELLERLRNLYFLS